MATALIGGLVAHGRRTRATSASSSRSPRSAQGSPTRFPGIGIFGEATRERASTAPTLVVLAVKPQQMREAARRSRRIIDERAGRAVDRRRHAHRAISSRWLGGYRAHRARDAQHAGAGRRGHQRRVRAARRSTRQAATLAGARAGSRRARSSGSSDEDDARCGDRRVRQRPGVRVLLPRSARSRRRASSASRAADARKLAYATFAGAIKLAQASDDEPGDAARAGHVEGRHHRARARDARGATRVKAKIRRRGQGGGARARRELGDDASATIDELPGPTAWSTRRSGILLDVVFGLFTYALLLRFAMQVLRAPFRNPLGQAVIALTDWIVKPLRRVLPGYKGIDWASLLATFLFQFLWLLAYSLVFGGFGAARRRRRVPAGGHADRARQGARCGC